MTVQHGVNEFVGRSDSDWAGDQATRQCITGHHCSVQGVTMYRGQKQTSISLSSCEPEFYAASACAGELLGLAELFKERCSSSRMDSDSARHILQRRGPGRTHARWKAMLGFPQWIRQKSLSVGRVDTKDNTADLFTTHLDGPRTRSLSRKLGLPILGGPSGQRRLRACEQRVGARV